MKNMKKFLSLIMVAIIICFTATPAFAVYYSSKNATINLNDKWLHLDKSELLSQAETEAERQVLTQFDAFFYNENMGVLACYRCEDLMNYDEVKKNNSSREEVSGDWATVSDFASIVGVNASRVKKKTYNGNLYFIVDGDTYKNVKTCYMISNGYLYEFGFNSASETTISYFLSCVKTSSPTTTTQSTQATQSSYQENTATMKNSYSDISSKQTSEIRGMLLVVTVAVVLSLIYYMLGKRSKNKTKDNFGLVSFLIPLFTSFAVYLVSYFLLYHFTTSEYYNIVALAIGLCLFFLLRAGLRSLWEKSKDDTQPQSSAEAEKKSKRKIGAISFLISFAVYLAISFCLYHFTEYIYKITPYAIGSCLFFSLRTYLQELQKKPENTAQPQNTTVSQINNDENKT